MNDNKVVKIYTDGACQGNPGPGGWGAVLFYGVHEKEVGGGEALTTNNRMELMAPIEALKKLKKPMVVEIYTDSQYLQKGMLHWIHNWKSNNWLTARKEPVKNADLWRILDDLCHMHTVSWHWIKAHNGHPENERADSLARRHICRR